VHITAVRHAPVRHAPVPGTPAPPAAWAEVRAHDRVMRYRRLGAGRAVLVLRPASAFAPLWPGLAHALAAHFRVILPDLPATAVDATAWLAGFLEGVGAAGVGVVAAGRFCAPALELALLDPDAVGRVALVHRGAGAGPALGGALVPTGVARVPLLVLRRGLAAGDALPQLARFLDPGPGEDGARPG
jgi:hypothetical protein